MKKSLLFAVAAMSMVASANAQIISRVEQAKNAKMANVAKSQVFDLSNVCEKEAQVATSPSQLKKKAPATKAAWSGAYYGRPDGAFYINWDEDGMGYVRPFLYGKPFTAYTYPNLTEGNASYEWTYYQVEKVDGKNQEVPYTTDSKDLTVDYGYTAVTVPILKATFANGTSSSYQLSGHKQGQTPVPTSIFTTPISGEALAKQGESPRDLLALAHYYGASDRTATEKYGWGYFTGKNQDGTPGGHWFGKNTLGYDLFAGAFEKPTKPYILNNVYLYMAALKVKGDAPLNVTVYRLDHMFPYKDGERVVIGEAEMSEDKVVAKGKVVLTKANTTEGGGIFKVSLVEIEDGLEYEVTPEIDFPILIVVDGLGGENVETASLLLTEDEFDEGKGELAFIGKKEANVLYGLNNFFSSGEKKSGISIFIGNTNPFLTFNYNLEDGKYKFPDNGGTLVREFGKAMEYVSFYTNKGSEEWDMTCNGADVPEWLTIELSDVMDNGEFSGEVQAKVTATALPAGVPYREAKVKFHILGDYKEFLFTQGEPTGINDVTATGNIKAHKVVENGQVLVVVGDKKYNMMGAEVK